MTSTRALLAATSAVILFHTFGCQSAKTTRPRAPIFTPSPAPVGIILGRPEHREELCGQADLIIGRVFTPSDSRQLVELLFDLAAVRPECSLSSDELQSIESAALDSVSVDLSGVASFALSVLKIQTDEALAWADILPPESLQASHLDLFLSGLYFRAGIPVKAAYHLQLAEEAPQGTVPDRIKHRSTELLKMRYLYGVEVRSLRSLNKDGDLTMSEFVYLLPVLTSSPDSSIVALSLRLASDAISDSIKIVLVNRLRETWDVGGADAWLSNYVARQTLGDTLRKQLLRDAATNGLPHTLEQLLRSAVPDTALGPDVCRRLGWMLADRDPARANTFWTVALSMSDTSSVEALEMRAFRALNQGELRTAGMLLSSLIRERPDDVRARIAYVRLLQQDFNLTALSDFLGETRAVVDSANYAAHFRTMESRIREATDRHLTVWQRPDGEKHWVYDDGDTRWLYDSDFRSLETRIFTNTAGKTRLWVAEEDREYLYDARQEYLDMYRFPDPEKGWVIAVENEDETRYYDEDGSWTGLRSFPGKDGDEVYVLTKDGRDLYHDEEMEYLGIYSYVSKGGNRVHVEEKKGLSVYYDHDWKPTGMIRLVDRPDIFGFVRRDHVELYHETKSGDLDPLNLRVIRSSGGTLQIEHGDDLRLYYSPSGDQMDYFAILKGGEIAALAMKGGGNCIEYVSGATRFNKCSETASRLLRIGELPSSYSFLKPRIVRAMGTLFRKERDTPYEMLVRVEVALKEIRRQERRRAIAEAFATGLKAWAGVYSAPSTTSTSSTSGSSPSSASGYSSVYTSDYGTDWRARSATSRSSSARTTTTTHSYGSGRTQRFTTDARAVGSSTFLSVTGTGGYRGSGTYQDVGSTTFGSYRDNSGNRMTSTSQQIGQTSFLSGRDNSSRSYSGTSQKVGNFIFHNMRRSDGTRVTGTTTVIGNTSFTDLNER
jgi:hypothetical protein